MFSFREKNCKTFLSFCLRVFFLQRGALSLALMMNNIHIREKAVMLSYKKRMLPLI